MFYTHSESYSFPNTSEGRMGARSIENVLHNCGHVPNVKFTTTSIEVGYSELMQVETEAKT